MTGFGSRHIIKVIKSPYSFGYEMLIGVKTTRDDGKTVFSAAMPIVYKDVETGSQFPPEGAVPLNYEEAQNLMDSLWEAGFRPSEGSGSAGALAATQLHLKDMQALVFQLMGDRK